MPVGVVVDHVSVVAKVKRAMKQVTRGIVSILICLIATPLFGNDPSEEYQKRVRDVTVLELLHGASKKGRIGKRTGWVSSGRRKVRSFASKEAKVKELETIKVALDRAKQELFEPHIPTRYVYLNDPRAGQVGKLAWRYDDFEVIPRVFQVIGANEALLSLGGKQFWFEGIGTSNLTDGDRVRLSGTFEVTGTKRYTTALGGSNQVWHLKLIDGSKVLKKASERWIEQNSRTWKFNDKPVEGWLADIERSTAIVMRADNGDAVRIPTSQLDETGKQSAARFRATRASVIRETKAEFVKSPDSNSWEAILNQHLQPR